MGKRKEGGFVHRIGLPLRLWNLLLTYVATIAEMVGLEQALENQAEFRELYPLLFHQRLHERFLREYGFDAQFWNALERSRGEVSGSVIVETLLDRRFENADIDILVPEQAKKPICDYLWSRAKGSQIEDDDPWTVNN